MAWWFFGEASDDTLWSRLALSAVAFLATLAIEFIYGIGRAQREEYLAAARKAASRGEELEMFRGRVDEAGRRIQIREDLSNAASKILRVIERGGHVLHGVFSLWKAETQALVDSALYPTEATTFGRGSRADPWQAEPLRSVDTNGTPLAESAQRLAARLRELGDSAYRAEIPVRPDYAPPIVQPSERVRQELERLVRQGTAILQELKSRSLRQQRGPCERAMVWTDVTFWTLLLYVGESQAETFGARRGDYSMVPLLEDDDPELIEAMTNKTDRIREETAARLQGLTSIWIDAESAAAETR